MNQKDNSPQVLGDPMESVTQRNDVRKAASAPIPATNERYGDNGLGGTPEKGNEARELTPEETKAHVDEQNQQIREEAEAMLAQFEDSRGWKVPEGLYRAYRTALIALAGILGLYLTTQTIVFVQQFSGLPLWSKVLGLSSFTLFAVMLAYVVYRLCGGLIRLQESPRLNLKALRQLAERKGMQAVTQEKQQKAKKLLLEYLETYPRKDRDWAEFKKMGTTLEGWDTLQKAREKLVASQDEQNAEDWIADFENTFLNKVDALADDRISKYAKRIGLACAVSPVPFIDRSIMIYGSLSMIRELCQIYNLKPAFSQSATIMAKSILMTYLSGVVDQGTDATADWIMDQTTMGAAGLGRDVMTKIGSKTTEGAILGVLVQRMGKSTGRMLRPVRV